MKIKLTLCSLVLVAGMISPAAVGRTWTSSDGSKTFEGDLQSYDSATGKVIVPHLRSRAKVYLAMGKLKAAQADIQEVYPKVNTAAGYISMRIEELEETEALKATILTALEKAE
jgi:hypothetical protein